jgi:hypothetical protein
MTISIMYQPLSDGTFTDKILDANFTVISNYTKDVDKLLTEMGKRIESLTTNQMELARKMPRKSKMLPFVVGVGVGIYVYKRSRGFAKRVDVVFENVNAGAKQRFTESKAPAETTVKDVSGEG